MIGNSLTHYRITAKLGEGGRGEVYRATDTKLGREVAIKVLPESFGQDRNRITRLKREGKVRPRDRRPGAGGTPFLLGAVLLRRSGTRPGMDQERPPSGT